MRLLSNQNFRIASLSIAVIGMLFVVIGVWFSLMIGVLGLALAVIGLIGLSKPNF